MDNHNDHNHNKNLHEYWCTNTPSSASDTSSVSGDIEDELIDLASVFIVLVMEQVVFYGRTLYENALYHTSALMG